MGLSLAGALLAFAGLAACAQDRGAAAGAAGIADSQLAPGLAVTYYDTFIRNVSEIPGWTESGRGRAGAPILRLDYQVGEGEVLTSGRDDGVVAVIDGYINFPEAGTYALAVTSNDGISLRIDGRTVLEDPDVHADRIAGPRMFEVTQPGWHPIEIHYFERKNTSTLILHWQRPGEDSMSVVPAEAFAHRP